jgi:Protein kinase domain
VQVLGNRYRLVDRLGVGGMGVVWRAIDEVLDRQVAVKILAARFAGNAVSCARVLAEARAAARLTHPHVAAVYDYGESVTDIGERVPFVVMELLSGRTLAQRLKQGPVPVLSALRICAQVASALAGAHALGLVHRDVKPANVMLTPGGAKVVDFGLAAAAGTRHDRSAGTVLGTPAYLAPERLYGDTVVAATDVYALGLLLYRLLAGRLPWNASTTTQMVQAHTYLEPDPLPKLPGVTPIVVDLVGRCLTQDPAGRPASVEVAVTLAHAAGIRVPLEDTDDELAGDGRTDPAAWADQDSGSGARAVVVSGPSVPRPVGPATPGEPYATRLARELDPDLDHVALRAQASALLRDHVGFDLALWAVLDPVTQMWASCVVDGGPHDERFEHELFANEYGQDDELMLVKLAAGAHVGTLSASTHGDPRMSMRFRNVLNPRGFTDELRLVFQDGKAAWGALLLYRTGGHFTAVDVQQLAPAGRPFADMLRHTLVRSDAESSPDVSPRAHPGEVAGSGGEVAGSGGGLAAGSGGGLAAGSRGGLAGSGPDETTGSRLRRIPRPRLGGGRREQPAVGPAPLAAGATPIQPPAPFAGTARISYDGRLLGITEDARALLRTGELGRVIDAVVAGRMSGLVDPTGGPSHDGRRLAFYAVPGEAGLAVAVQRIRPHQVSELIAHGLGLNPAQWRLLGAAARGRSIPQIAQETGMSAYAVQDELTRLFSAFGVDGRVNLVKTLFFEHYEPLHAVDVRVSDGPPARPSS